MLVCKLKLKFVILNFENRKVSINYNQNQLCPYGYNYFINKPKNR